VGGKEVGIDCAVRRRVCVLLEVSEGRIVVFELVHGRRYFERCLNYTK
jgi:hypothetical protein